jgi:hypothetical protein
VASEIFPQRLRGKGMTLTTLANWYVTLTLHSHDQQDV